MPVGTNKENAHGHAVLCKYYTDHVSYLVLDMFTLVAHK